MIYIYNSVILLFLSFKLSISSGVYLIYYFDDYYSLFLLLMSYLVNLSTLNNKLYTLPYLSCFYYFNSLIYSLCFYFHLYKANILLVLTNFYLLITSLYYLNCLNFTYIYSTNFSNPFIFYSFICTIVENLF